MAKVDISDEEKQQAYITYLNLGASRNLPDVARAVNKPLRTIQEWAKTLNWDYRVHYDDQVPGAFAPIPGGPRINTDTIMTKPEYRQLLGGLIRDFAERFEAGEVYIKNVNEFEKIVKLDMLLAGEATSRSDVNVEGGPSTVNQYQVNVEQTINNNPKMRELIGEMWREYNGKRGDDTRDGDGEIIDVTADSNDENPVKGQLNKCNDEDYGSVPIDYREKQPSGLINNVSNYSDKLSTLASGGIQGTRGIQMIKDQEVRKAEVTGVKIPKPNWLTGVEE